MKRMAVGWLVGISSAAAGFAGQPAAQGSAHPRPAALTTGNAECPKYVFRNGFEGLSQPGGTGTPIVYATSGGYGVMVNLHTITITDPSGHNKVEHWGDPHENLNGKHIKDWGGAEGWDGSQRTIVLGDGTKITMRAVGPQGVVLTTSIYDGNRNVQIDNVANTISHHGIDPLDTEARDAEQHDGETARFETAASTAVAYYTNIYNEDEDFTIVVFDQPLGESGGCANPSQTNDYFDDPRLGHT